MSSKICEFISSRLLKLGEIANQYYLIKNCVQLHSSMATYIFWQCRNFQQIMIRVLHCSTCLLFIIYIAGFVDGVLKSPGHHNIWSHSWDEGPTQQHSKNKFFKWREKSDGIKIFAYFRKGHQSLS